MKKLILFLGAFLLSQGMSLSYAGIVEIELLRDQDEIIVVAGDGRQFAFNIEKLSETTKSLFASFPIEELKEVSHKKERQDLSQILDDFETSVLLGKRKMKIQDVSFDLCGKRQETVELENLPQRNLRSKAVKLNSGQALKLPHACNDLKSKAPRLKVDNPSKEKSFDTNLTKLEQTCDRANIYSKSELKREFLYWDQISHFFDKYLIQENQVEVLNAGNNRKNDRAFYSAEVFSPANKAHQKFLKEIRLVRENRLEADINEGYVTIDDLISSSGILEENLGNFRNKLYVYVRENEVETKHHSNGMGQTTLYSKTQVKPFIDEFLKDVEEFKKNTQLVEDLRKNDQYFEVKTFLNKYKKVAEHKVREFLKNAPVKKVPLRGNSQVTFYDIDRWKELEAYFLNNK